MVANVIYATLVSSGKVSTMDATLSANAVYRSALTLLEVSTMTIISIIESSIQFVPTMKEMQSPVGAAEGVPVGVPDGVPLGNGVGIIVGTHLNNKILKSKLLFFHFILLKV